MKTSELLLGGAVGLFLFIITRRVKTPEPPLGPSPGPDLSPAALRVWGYAPIIWREASHKGVDPAVIAAIIMWESVGDPDAVRYEARVDDYAYGLMQIRLQTAQWMEQVRIVSGTATAEMLLDPATNIRYGTAYFANRLAAYHGNARDAISAYNAGTVYKSGGEYTNQHYVTGVTNQIPAFREAFRAAYPYDLPLADIAPRWGYRRNMELYRAGFQPPGACPWPPRGQATREGTRWIYQV